MDANQPIDYFDLIKTQPHLFRGKGVPFEIVTGREQIQGWEAARRKELEDQHAPLEWSKIGVILDDPYIVVLRDLVRFPDGRLGGYFRVINRADLRGGQGAVVLPWVGGKIILLYQYRHATRQ
jgi:ADP-ribose pyrophosphatase